MFTWRDPSPTGPRLFWVRVGTVAGIVGWLAIGAAVVVAVVAGIVHALA